MERQEFIEAVRGILAAAWQEAGHDRPMPLVEPDANFFDLGVVDSFGMLLLVSSIEDLVDRDLDILDVGIDRLFSIDGFYEVLFEDVASGP